MLRSFIMQMQQGYMAINGFGHTYRNEKFLFGRLKIFTFSDTLKDIQINKNIMQSKLICTC